MAMPKKIVEGILENEPGGVKGVQSWDLVLQLMPWRRCGEEKFPELPVRLLIASTELQLDESMKRLCLGDAVRVTISRIEPPKGDSDTWLARGLMPVLGLKDAEIDPDLRQALAKRNEPVILQDEVLGKLQFNRQMRWYSGQRRFEGKPYEFSVTQSGIADDRLRDLKDVESARKIIFAFEERMPAIRSAIVNHLLPLYNDNWRGDRPRLDPKGFLGLVQLSSAVVFAKGTATLYFEDGDLFLGHTIEVRLRGPDGGVSEVCLAG